MKEITFYVQGMHCPSCELLIEKKLLQKKNIESVDASIGQGKVVVFYQGQKPSLKKLNQEFVKEGYFFSQTPLAKKKEPLLTSSNLQVLGIAFLLILVFAFFSRPSIASKVVVNSSSSFLAFLLFGLIAGFSSCAALVGGIILSMSKQWPAKFQPHFLFNLGRLIAFGFFGFF